MDNSAYSIHVISNKISRAAVLVQSGFVRKEQGRHTTWNERRQPQPAFAGVCVNLRSRLMKNTFSRPSYMIAQKKVKQEAECENVGTRKTINSCVTFKIGFSSRAFVPQLRHQVLSVVTPQQTLTRRSHESFQSRACINPENLTGIQISPIL